MTIREKKGGINKEKGTFMIYSEEDYLFTKYISGKNNLYDSDCQPYPCEITDQRNKRENQ